MLKKKVKRLLKNNQYIFALSSAFIYWYLRFVYFSSTIEFVWLEGYRAEDFAAEKGTIFAIWHNRLAFGSRIFKGHRDTYALVSPHSDGKVIGTIINKFGFGTIDGSTNKGATIALRNILSKLSSGANIVITPDGPRGPVYKINSSITQIAVKYGYKLVPVSCSSTKYFNLKSWDRLIMPLPFSTIKIVIGSPLELGMDKQENDLLLEQQLIELNTRSEL